MKHIFVKFMFVKHKLLEYKSVKHICEIYAVTKIKHIKNSLDYRFDVEYFFLWDQHKDCVI